MCDCVCVCVCVPVPVLISSVCFIDSLAPAVVSVVGADDVSAEGEEVSAEQIDSQ